MRRLLTTWPIVGFVLVTFAITYFFWFLPVLFSLPKDLTFVSLLLGGCGPMLGGYMVMLAHSDSSVRIGSASLFMVVFLLSAITLALRIYFTGDGLPDVNGKIPRVHEVGVVGYLLLTAVCLLLAFHASNATNRDLRENYIHSFLPQRSKLGWYAVAFLIFPCVALISYGIGKFTAAATTDFMIKTDPVLLIGVFSTFFFFGGNEEFGWRGFLQKEMQKKYSPLVLVLVMTFLWSIWHLPLHYNGFYSNGGIKDLLPRFLFTLPLSIIFTWLYNRSGYSILAVMILHSMLNNIRIFGQAESILMILFVALAVFCFIDDRMWKRKSNYA